MAQHQLVAFAVPDQAGDGQLATAPGADEPAPGESGLVGHDISRKKSVSGEADSGPFMPGDGLRMMRRA